MAKHNLPSDGDPEMHAPAQLDGALELLEHPVNMINCPSRRSGTFIHGSGNAQNATNLPFDLQVGKGDYAANVGDQETGYDFRGPTNLFRRDDRWDVIGTLGELRLSDGVFTGISFQRSEVELKNISDGTSNTYLYGERNLNIDHYDTGKHTGDNETWCTGANNDNYRVAFELPRPDQSGPGPDGKESRKEGGNIFGSAHPSVWHMSFCDGHVEGMSYDIEWPCRTIPSKPA